jgi:hypothetical protein
VRRASILLALFVAFTFAPFARGGQWNHVIGPTDFTIEILELSTFTARTVLCDPDPVGWCDGVVDSMLWLYSSDGMLVAENDDHPNEYGSTWASRLSLELAPGTYRLRAGRCCGNPDAWRATDVRGYHLETTVDVIAITPSPSVELSPDPTPEPTLEPTPTPSPDPTPTPTVEPSPTPEPPSPTPEPTPDPTPTPTATPSPTPPPPPSPTEPPPSPTEPPPSPTEPPPSPTEAPPTPTDPPPAIELPSPDEVVAAVGEAVDAAVAVVGEVAAAYANLGADLSPAEREEMAAPVVASIIISQVGGAAVAAANAAGTRPGHRKG